MSFSVDRIGDIFVIRCEADLNGKNSSLVLPLINELVEKTLERRSICIVFDLIGRSDIDHHFLRSLAPVIAVLKNQNKKFFAVNVPRAVIKFISESSLGGIVQPVPSLDAVAAALEAMAKNPAKAPVKAPASIPKVDITFVNVFITAAMSTLKIQCGVEVVPGKPCLKGPNGLLTTDIAGVIGLTSTAFCGSIAICFPAKTFLAVMTKMIGEEFHELTDELNDGAGELLNIIFGQAKIVLNEKGYGIEKAIPTVVRSNDLKIRHLTPTATIVLPFTSESGPFLIEVGLDRR